MRCQFPVALLTLRALKMDTGNHCHSRHLFRKVYFERRRFKSPVLGLVSNYISGSWSPPCFKRVFVCLVWWVVTVHSSENHSRCVSVKAVPFMHLKVGDQKCRYKGKPQCYTHTHHVKYNILVIFAGTNSLNKLLISFWTMTLR